MTADEAGVFRLNLTDNEYDRLDDSHEVICRNPDLMQRIVHALINGKHIDHFMFEEFGFLEKHPRAWEEFFFRIGYRLKRNELGGNLFFFLEARSDLVSQTRLSRGATFLGLYLAWHFFMQGPGEPDSIAPEEVFRRLVSSYPFPFLRSVLARRGGSSTQLEPSEDQAEKLRGNLRRELAELSKYRFIDVRPNARAPWDDLVIHRLPALYRFWELALHVRVNCGGGSHQEADIGQVIEQVWGSMELDSDEDE